MRRTASHEIKGPGGALRVRAEDVAAVDLAMLIEGETSGRPLDEVLVVYARSRSTYYEKLRRFREHGLEGLLTRPPGPRGPWRRPIEILKFVVATRVRHPDQSAADIAAQLERLGHRISVRSVERTLSQFGLTRPAARASDRHHVERPVTTSGGDGASGGDGEPEGAR
jgi:transposase